MDDDMDMADFLVHAARFAQKEGMDKETFLRCAGVFWNSTFEVFEAMAATKETP
jgi:hypothetical protein